MAVSDPPPTVGDPTVGNRNRPTRESWGPVQSPHPRAKIAGVLLSVLPGDSKSHFSLPTGGTGLPASREAPRPRGAGSWQ